MHSLIHSTLSDVSRKLRRGEEAVEGILDRQVAQTVDWASLKALGVLGLDEIALTKGHWDSGSGLIFQGWGGFKLLQVSVKAAGGGGGVSFFASASA